MARINTNVGERVFTIRNWRGVNQAEEGEARLENGEAAEMVNFRITSGGALRKRAGSRNIAGLMNAYNVTVGTEAVTLLKETAYSEAAFTLFPRATADSIGTPIGDGETVSASYGNADSYEGYYYWYDPNAAGSAEDGGEDGGASSSAQDDDAEEEEEKAAYPTGLYRFKGCKYTPPTEKADSNKRIFSGNANFIHVNLYVVAFDTVPQWHNGQWDLSGAKVVALYGGAAGEEKWDYREYKYVIPTASGGVPSVFTYDSAPTVEELLAGADNGINSDGVYMLAQYESSEANIDWGWRLILNTKSYDSAVYEWEFYGTGSQGNGANADVRGLWSGFVGGAEVLCAACNGYLWQITQEDGAWSKVSCGALDTSGKVCMFGFDEKLYILNGSGYKVWDGLQLKDVEGYRPMVATEVLPTGGGTSLEQVNKLTAARRCRFSPDGTATVFRLPEENIASVDYVKYVAGGAATEYTADTAAGTITFASAPEEGVDTIEVGWTAAESDAEAVRKMRFAELFNGAQDTRVFLCGDGSNRLLYSGLDYNGQPRADYFPDLNVAAIGESNTPVTAIIRHYNRLLVFKADSAYSVYYSSVSTADGITIPGFYISPINRDVGCCAYGQARLVENKPRTLDGRSVIEWRATSTSGNVSSDTRNAQRISQRVDKSIRTFDLSEAETFYDKINHEYYVIGPSGTALVNNVEADAWYIYTAFDALCLINYKDELYYGTADGYLRHFSHEYTNDNDAAVEAYWESGSMPFAADFKRKYSAMLWVGIKPENNGYLAVTAQTDRKSEFAEYGFTENSEEAVPTMHRIKLKAKKFTYYKLILRSDKPGSTATVVSADMRIRETGYVR